MPWLQWSFTWKNNVVSSIAKLDAHRVVLGSQQGFLSVLNWKQSQKVAFATVARPVVQCTWFSRLDAPHPGILQMGIHHLMIEQMSEEPPPTTGGQGPVFGNAKATWVTSCGWAMVCDIDLKEGKPVRKSTVLHRTNRVRCLNHRNEEVELGGWSLPSQEVRMAGTEGFLCWERVPDVIRRLPDHDKFVLDDHQSTVRTPPSLRVMNRRSGQMHNVNLGKGKMTVTAVAMHSSHEWILLSTKEDGVRFYNARKKIA